MRGYELKYSGLMGFDSESGSFVECGAFSSYLDQLRAEVEANCSGVSLAILDMIDSLKGVLHSGNRQAIVRDGQVYLPLDSLRVLLSETRPMIESVLDGGYSFDREAFEGYFLGPLEKLCAYVEDRTRLAHSQRDLGSGVKL